MSHDWNKHLHPDRARDRRRSVPIMAYVGPNGFGKSLAAVYDSMPSLDSGRPVLSTVRLLDWRNPRPCEDGDDCAFPIDHEKGHAAAHPYWQPFRTWTDLLNFEYGDVLMDEMAGVASSRDAVGPPTAVQTFVMKLRKTDICLRWTAPAWARGEKIVREITQGVTDCNGRMPVRDQSGRVWPRNRLFRWNTYDARDFDEFTFGAKETAKVEGRTLAGGWFWGPGSDVFNAYDSTGGVLAVDHVLDSGRCSVCNGKRTPAPCSCAEYVDKRPPRGRRQPEHVHV